MAFSARITALPPTLALLLIAAILLGATFAGIGLRRRLATRAAAASDLAVAGIMFECLAMLYSVLVAFMVFGLWGEYNKARSVAEQEAASLLGLTRIVQDYPRATPQVRELRQALAAYADSVQRQEYPAMARQEESAPTARAMERLWAAACAIEPGTRQESDLHSMILAQMAAAQGARMSRLLAASEGLPEVLWLVILCSTGVTLGFSVFLATQGAPLERTMAGGFALGVALLLFAIIQLNHPFVGALAVHGGGLESVPRLTR